MHAPVYVERLAAGGTANTLVDISVVSQAASAAPNSCFALLAACTGNGVSSSSDSENGGKRGSGGSQDGVASLRVGKLNPRLLAGSGGGGGGNSLASKWDEETRLRANLSKWV